MKKFRDSLCPVQCGSIFGGVFLEIAFLRDSFSVVLCVHVFASVHEG